MAYDERLASRIRTVLKRRRGISERKMFGGLAFLMNGHMCCGIVKQDLMVRVGREHHEATLSEPHVRPMDFTGKPMRGMVYVAPDGFADEAHLEKWVERGLSHARKLPPK